MKGSVANPNSKSLAEHQEFLNGLKERYHADDQTIANLEMRMNGKHLYLSDLCLGSCIIGGHSSSALFADKSLRSNHNSLSRGANLS